MVRLAGSYTRDEKREMLVELILEAYTEGANPTRVGFLPVPGYPFEPRINQVDWRMTLAEAIKTTEALELLAEMVGAIEEEE